MSKSSSLREGSKFLSGNILIFSLVDLLGNFSRGMVFPYVSLYVLALGGDATRIGFVSSLRPLAGLIMFPIAGYIADRANRVRLIVLGSCYSASIVLLYMLAPSWQVVAVAALLQGFAVFLFPARSALIADSLAPGDRGRGIAAMNTISSILAIFAPYIAGVVIEAYGADMGMRILYAVMFTLYAVNISVQARFLKETRPSDGDSLRLSNLPRVLKDAYRGIPALLRRFPRPLKALTGVIILSFMINGVASPYWVVYALEHIGLSSSQWGLILLIEMLLKLIIFMPAGVLVDRWGRSASLLTALLISLISIPAFILVEGFLAVLAVRAAIAVAFAIAIPACTALMADLVPRDIRGQVMAAVGQGGIMIGVAGGGTGGPAMGYLVTVPLMAASLAGGYLYTWHPTYPWLFALAATVVSIVLTALFIRDPENAEV
ncbi:MAG: MFS transporter [Chloroflexi bacterium]|nr:MFS transporter [Chloroflexota bacterium]